MPTEMLVISKADLEELTEQIKQLNRNFASLTGMNEPTVLLTRNQVMQQYGFSDRATKKIFTTLLKDKVVDIGKEQRLSKKNIDTILEQGVKLK